MFYVLEEKCVSLIKRIYLLFKRYLLRDIKYLIEESECGINVDIGMDGPVESPPPGLRPLVRTKTTQFYANPATPWYNSPASSTICKYIYIHNDIV